VHRRRCSAVALDGLDVNARDCAVRDGMVLEALVTSTFSTMPPACSATWLGRGDTRGIVVHDYGRHSDCDRDDQAQRIGGRARRLRPGTRFAESRPVVEGDPGNPVDTLRVPGSPERIRLYFSSRLP